MTLYNADRRFRQIRERSGKTQSEVARAVGMRRETLRRFQCARGTNFSLTKLLRLLSLPDLEIDFVSDQKQLTVDSLREERRRIANAEPNSRQC